MNRNLQAIRIFDLHGGQDGSLDSVPTRYSYTKMGSLRNWYVDHNRIKTRPPKMLHLASAFPAGVQKYHQFTGDDHALHLLIFSNGRVYLDTAATEITNGLTLTTDIEATFTLTNHDGKVFGTDAENTPFVYVGGVLRELPDYIATLTNGSILPSRCGSIASFHETLFMFDIDDPTGTFPFRTAWSNAFNATAPVPTLYTDWPEDFSNNFARDHVGRGMARYADTLLFLLDRSIEYCRLSEASNVNFAFDSLDSDTGICGASAFLSTRAGFFFAGINGIHWIQRVSEDAVKLPAARYVGKPVEDVWSLINPEKRHIIRAVEIPELNGVMFCVPYGRTQATNNLGLFFNYDEWSKTGQDLHPAFSKWDNDTDADEDGTPDEPWAFTAAEKVEIDGRQRVLMGDSDGRTFILGDRDGDADAQGVTWDNKDEGDVPFVPEFETPNYGDHNQESIWQEVALFSDRDSEKVWEIEQSNYGSQDSFEDNLTSVSEEADELTEDASPDGEAEEVPFILSSSFLTGQNSGITQADMWDHSLFTSLRAELTDGIPCTLEGMVLRRRPGGTW